LLSSGSIIRVMQTTVRAFTVTSASGDATVITKTPRNLYKVHLTHLEKVQCQTALPDYLCNPEFLQGCSTKTNQNTATYIVFSTLCSYIDSADIIQKMLS
jgi:hypothetical protein